MRIRRPWLIARGSSAAHRRAELFFEDLTGEAASAGEEAPGAIASFEEIFGEGIDVPWSGIEADQAIEADPPKAVNLPRTTITAGASRTEKLALARAKTLSDVNSALATTHPLGDYTKYKGMSYAGGKAKVPEPSEVESRRTKLAEAIDAVSRQDFSTAISKVRELALPLPEVDAVLATDQFLEAQWLTAFSLGMIKFGKSFEFDNTDPPLVAVQGFAHYVSLLNAMAMRGVTGLKSPPTNENLLAYLFNLRIEVGHLPAQEQRIILSRGHQMVMNGFVVHYALASGKDPIYPEVTQDSWYVFEPPKGDVQTGAGRAWRYPSKESAQKGVVTRGSKLWQVIQTVGKKTSKPTLPDSFGDIVAQDTYGYRYESNCAGMASLRVRTMPPGFEPVGCVHGTLRKDLSRPAHIVLVYSDRGYEDDPWPAPANLYMSSNGKPPILIKRGSDGAYTAKIIQDAVEAEFGNTYRGSPSGSEFAFGIGVPTYPPGVRMLTGSPDFATRMNELNHVADRILLSAYADNAVRFRNPKNVPDVPWNLLVIR
ncbi:MAG TPA: hypothetical protein VF516_28465 [Kofleriaceae bacterium]